MQSVEQRDEVEMLSLMLLIRRFEERASQQYQAQKIGGFCHLYIGQEAVVVGAVSAVRDDDYIITAYRDHGLAFACKYREEDRVTLCFFGDGAINQGAFHEALNLIAL